MPLQGEGSGQMFSGVFQHSIDAKGRTSLPAHFRELLSAQGAEKLFITPDLIDPCLVAFAPSAWEPLAEKVTAKSTFDRDIRLLSRAFIPTAQECPADKPGRILIPPRPRAHAGLVEALNATGTGVPQLVARRRELLARGGDLLIAVRNPYIAKILKAAGGPDLVLLRSVEEGLVAAPAARLRALRK